MTLPVVLWSIPVLVLLSVARVFVVGGLGLILAIPSRVPASLRWRFVLEKRMAKERKAVANKEAQSQLFMPQRLHW